MLGFLLFALLLAVVAWEMWRDGGTTRPRVTRTGDAGWPRGDDDEGMFPFPPEGETVTFTVTETRRAQIDAALDELGCHVGTWDMFPAEAEAAPLEWLWMQAEIGVEAWLGHEDDSRTAHRVACAIFALAFGPENL